MAAGWNYYMYISNYCTEFNQFLFLQPFTGHVVERASAPVNLKGNDETVCFFILMCNLQ